MVGRHRQRRQRETAELNITAFMNLMVILVPFLLITAVFSRVAVLELQMPAPSAETTAAEEQGLNLEILVRDGAIEVADRRGGLLKRIPAGDGGHDYRALAAFLERVKAEYPEHTEATLLLEPDVPYDVLVQVMDAVRVIATETEAGPALAELFPDISIGDAPAAGGGS